MTKKYRRNVYRDGKEVRVNGKYVKEHRLVWEQHYKCCLLPHARIGHKNGIKTDNRIKNLYRLTKKHTTSHFGKYAEPIPKNRRCMKCGSSKTKIDIDHGRPKAHWAKGHGEYAGGYLCVSCYHEIYRREHPEPHRDLYEREGGDDGSECCILPWGQIHFINEDKTDIRIENMVLLRRGGSALLKKPRIPKDRRCMACGSDGGHGDWSKTEDGFVCSLCVTEARRADLKRAKDFDDYLRIVETAKKVLFDPNFKMPPPKRCARCNSTTTTKRSKKKGRTPDWYRWGDLWQCRRCYNRDRYRRIKGLSLDVPPPKKESEAEKRARKKLSRDRFNAWRRARRRALNPSMHRYVAPPQAPKRCAECGSTTTSKNVKGTHNWYRLEVPIGPIGYLDNNCYRKRQRRINNQRPGVREK